MHRLTSAVSNNTTTKKSQTVEYVSAEEVKGTSVVMKAKKQFYIGFGPGMVSNLNTDTAGVNFALGYLFGLDHQFSLRTGIEGVTVGQSNADQIE